MKALLIFAVRIYRLFLSPFLGGQCRFIPSCSVYAEEAFARHGAWQGGRAALRRLFKCHPLHPGGVDPVE